MQNNPLDDIVKCDIDISSPGSSDATFDSILLIVAPPAKAGKKTMSKVTPISKADELLDYGYTVDDEAYIAATVAFSQSPSPDELYICVRQMVSETVTVDDTEEETEGEEVTEGDVEESTGTTLVYENLKLTLVRAMQECSFYGIHISEFRSAEDIASVIEWTEANEKLFGFEYIEYDKYPVKNPNYLRSFSIFSGLAAGYGINEQPAVNRYAALAWMAKCFGYDPGTETWNLKPLKTILPSVLDTAMKKELASKNINTFLRYAGDNVAIGGYTLGGEWIDVIRFRDWLKNEMQINVFNVLKTNKKVPFTTQGNALIEGAMKETLMRGQDIGGISLTEYDAEDNAVPGFTVTVPAISSYTEAERKARKLTGCKYTARLAGAIHLVEISGNLTF